MDLVVGALKVVLGSFVLFTTARITFARLVPRAGWMWVALVFLLGLANMVVHRLIGSTINPPFFTAVVFAVTLMGMSASPPGTPDSEVPPWHRRAVVGLVIGTVIGWLAFAEVGARSRGRASLSAQPGGVGCKDGNPTLRNFVG